VKNAIATITRGFLLGLGFAVAAIGATFVAQAYWMNKYQSGATAGAYPNLDSITSIASKMQHVRTSCCRMSRNRKAIGGSPLLVR